MLSLISRPWGTKMGRTLEITEYLNQIRYRATSTSTVMVERANLLNVIMQNGSSSCCDIEFRENIHICGLRCLMGDLATSELPKFSIWKNLQSQIISGRCWKCKKAFSRHVVDRHSEHIVS